MLTSPKRVAALGFALTALVASGCGSDDESGTTSSSAGTASTAAAAPAGKKIKVGLVTDIGGLNDRSFNALANKGLQDAKSQLGVEGRVITSKSNSDYVPNLSTARPAEVRPRHRRRLPHGGRHGHGREEVPRRRTSRSSTTRARR